MDQLNGTVTLAYLDEDNKQRIFFRVVPLCTRDGYLFADAQTRYPDQGSLRVVPDKREQSTFKERMRGIGTLCAICLGGDAKEISKVRQNKNYQPQQGEYNQFAIYSDVVCGFEPDALFEVIDASNTATAQAPLTAQVLLLSQKVLYGPVDREQLADAAVDALKPYGNDHYLLQTIKLPDGTQHTMYWNPDATQNKRIRKSKAARSAKEEPVGDACTESAAPAVPAEAAAPLSEAAPAPSPKPPEKHDEPCASAISEPKTETPTAKPTDAPKTPEALPLGKPLQILDSSLTFSDHLERLNQTVSADANRFDEETLALEEEPAEAVKYSGTPLERASVREPVIVGRPKPLHYVVERQIKAAQPQSAADPSGMSAEQVLQALFSVWRDPETHEQILRGLSDDEDFSFAFLKTMQTNGRELRILAAAQAQLADIEAERLSLLMQLERLRDDRRKMEKETLQSISEQKKTQLKELETAVSNLQAQKDSLEAATVALSNATQKETEDFVRANTWHGQPYGDAIALLIPTVGVHRTVEELLGLLRTGLTAVGFDISEDDAYQLLIHFALADELCLYGDNEQDALRFCKAFVHSLGLDKVCACAPKDSQVRVVDALAENACRTPIVLITQLSARGQRSVGMKTLMYATVAEYLSGAAPECPACPKMRIPPLANALPDNGTAATVMPAISMESLDELQKIVAPLLDEQESWFEELKHQLADSDLEISDTTLRDMRSFVSAASQKLRGGFISAADAAVCHWVIPLVQRRGCAERTGTMMAYLPRALAMLGVR